MSQKSKQTKCLVIDASVARAAGESEHSISQRCRDFLQEVLNICHCLVMTTEIRNEWEKHQSRFVFKWRGTMTAKKKIIYRVASADNLEEDIMNTATSEKDREAMRKDWPLLQAALATDCIIISLDEEAKRLFSRAAQHVIKLKQIAWINPTQDNDAIECLKDPSLMKKHLLRSQRS